MATCPTWDIGTYTLRQQASHGGWVIAESLVLSKNGPLWGVDAKRSKFLPISTVPPTIPYKFGVSNIFRFIDFVSLKMGYVMPLFIHIY